MIRYLLIPIILIGVLVVSPLSVGADVNTQLQKMFNKWGLAAATRPGAYESQTQGALTGGSLSMRIPNETLSVISVAPPRFKMGCGGIDLYLGSISFPSLSRFTDMLQQLGTAGVAGFAFQLAMLELCQQCENVIAKLEAAARAINNAGRLQPCQLGQELAKAYKGKPNDLKQMTSAVGDLWQMGKEARGAISDYWSDRDTAKDKTTKDAADDMASDPQTDIRGNLVYKSLMNAGWTKDDTLMMMSVTGTVVVGDKGTISYYRPVLKMSDLIEARSGTDIVPIYVCLGADPQCLAPDDTGTTGDVDGFRRRAELVYQDIVDKVLTFKTPLSAEQIDLINRSAVPFYRLLVDYANNPAKAEVLKHDISEILAIEMAYIWLYWAHDEVLKQALTVKQLQPNFVASLAEFESRLTWQVGQALSEYQAKLTSLSSVHNYTSSYQHVMKKPVSPKKKRSTSN
jgi:conjugative transfer pilus assembly protein TraH